MTKPATKAESLADWLAERIADGTFVVGGWLPSERELAARHGVDRSTVRRAIRTLVQRRLVEMQSGTGARVAAPALMRRSASDITTQVGTWRGFHVSAELEGREPFTRTTISEVEIEAVPARWLGVPIGTAVLQRARVQGVADQPPIQMSTTWVTPQIADQLPVLRQVDTGPGGIHSRIEELGYVLQFEDAISCRLPLAREQEQLQISRHDPVLNVWRRCYDQNGRVVEVTHRVVVGDRHELGYRYG